MKRFNVTIFNDNLVIEIKDLEVLAAYVYLGVNFFDQGISCPSTVASNLLSQHFDISEMKAEYLIERLCELELDLKFMVYEKKQ